jgi:hypothetical protein
MLIKFENYKFKETALAYLQSSLNTTTQLLQRVAHLVVTRAVQPFLACSD